MAIVVTALGTAQNKASADPWTPFSSITLANGDSIILCLAPDETATNAPTSVKWNNINLSADLASFAAERLLIYSLHNVTGATGDVVVDWNAIPTAMAAALYKVSGLVTTNTFDKSITSFGTSTTPTSTQTVTLSQTDELLVGMINTEGPNGDAAGTWDAGANQTTDNNQRLGTTGAGAASNNTIATATKIVTATTGGIASKTGITSRDWAAGIVTYKADTGPQVTQPYYVRTGGVPHMRIGRPGSIIGRSW